MSSPDPDFDCGALGAFAAPVPIPPIVDPEVALAPIPVPIPVFEGLDTAGFAMPIPIPPVCVLHAFPLDAPGGGARLKLLELPGGGGSENDEDDDCCCACELSDRLFIDAPILLKTDVWACCPMGVPVAQGFEAVVGEVVEVDQLIEEVEVWVVFWEGGGGEKADWAGCRGFENCVLAGVKAPKPERSGVTVLNEDACCTFVVDPAGGVGVDQENAGG